MNDEGMPVGRELLDRIARHDLALSASVADVVEELDGATLVADGRAPDLREFNHAALIRSGSDEALQRLITFFEKRKRQPAVVLDPDAPDGIAAKLSASGFKPVPSRSDLMLWNPDARHIYTAAEVYMTMATNATLNEYLRIATLEMPEPAGEQARIMLTLQFRTQGFSFWFGLFNGTAAGVCPVFVRDEMAQVGPVVVSPEYRLKGVGLALVNYLTRQSRKDGASVTYLFNDHNGPATGLCQTAGYQTVMEDARQVWVREG
ncbi:MAG TPA: GNAT family N-acetyltransferase [Armatimonadota bacterium]|jgi:GNAT superfamily N-acetyltransferase